jgi:hypothetical protein
LAKISSGNSEDENAWSSAIVSKQRKEQIFQVNSKLDKSPIQYSSLNRDNGWIFHDQVLPNQVNQVPLQIYTNDIHSMPQLGNISIPDHGKESKLQFPQLYGGAAVSVAGTFRQSNNTLNVNPSYALPQSQISSNNGYVTYNPNGEELSSLGISNNYQNQRMTSITAPQKPYSDFNFQPTTSRSAPSSYVNLINMPNMPYNMSSPMKVTSNNSKMNLLNSTMSSVRTTPQKINRQYMEPIDGYIYQV